MDEDEEKKIENKLVHQFSSWKHFKRKKEMLRVGRKRKKVCESKVFDCCVDFGFYDDFDSVWYLNPWFNTPLSMTVTSLQIPKLTNSSNYHQLFILLPKNPAIEKIKKSCNKKLKKICLLRFLLLSMLCSTDWILFQLLLITKLLCLIKKEWFTFSFDHHKSIQT